MLPLHKRLSLPHLPGKPGKCQKGFPGLEHSWIMEAMVKYHGKLMENGLHETYYYSKSLGRCMSY